MDRLVKVKLSHWPFEKYVEYTVLVNELRGELIEQAIAQMKISGKPYAIVKCPCCGRLVKISIEEVIE